MGMLWVRNPADNGRYYNNPVSLGGSILLLYLQIEYLPSVVAIISLHTSAHHESARQDASWLAPLVKSVGYLIHTYLRDTPQ